MNIVKLKDILMPEDLKISKFFNENLKGKYAYWIKMRYIFPLDSLDYKTYIKYEQLDHVHLLGPDILPHIDLYSEECCMADVVNIYLDIEETERINSISEYAIINEYAIDFDLDVQKLRHFRSWLASELLYFNTKIDGTYLNNYTPEQIHVLEYYKNNMYNEVVKQLSIFGYDNKIAYNINNKSCGCCTNSMDIYNLSGTQICNALDIYKLNIHNAMVEMFKEISFWSSLNKKFIALFKKYIDNIIKIGLIIDNGNNSAILNTCDCNITDTANNEKILRSLSDSLQYIHDDNLIGHKNFIQDSLYNWAENLYDYMSWIND